MYVPSNGVLIASNATSTMSSAHAAPLIGLLPPALDHPHDLHTTVRAGGSAPGSSEPLREQERVDQVRGEERAQDQADHAFRASHAAARVSVATSSAAFASRSGPMT